METAQTAIEPYRKAIYEDDEVHRDIYNKINANTNAVSALTAEVRVLTGQNYSLIELLQQNHKSSERNFKWVSSGLFLLVMFLAGALVYGAIGERGLHAVRKSAPRPSDIISWHNELDDWRLSQTKV